MEESILIEKSGKVWHDLWNPNFGEERTIKVAYYRKLGVL